MEATVVDLRYRMNKVLKALERNEIVRVLCRGKVKGVIHPTEKKTAMKIRDHGFFGCQADERSVETVLDQLRGVRHRDL